MSVEERNMELMQTLDDAWNAQDVDVFRQRHKPDVVVRWPGKPPTHGIEDHTQESIEFWQTFPDQHLDNRPYRVFFASGDWTCSIARFTGTMSGPMMMPDSTSIPPTGRSFDVDFYTVALWDNGQIVEEHPNVRPRHLHEADRPQRLALKSPAAVDVFFLVESPILKYSSIA